MRLIVSPAAEADVLEIWEYIARDNPSAADGLLDRLHALFRRLMDHPELGVNAEKLAPGLRMFPTGNYIVFYRPTSTAIELVRVLHGARDITADLFGEP